MGKTDYDALRAQTVSSGQDEEAVTVNTRALIDKVLARYSGEWTTLRELLQNAADASASRVTIKFETLPSAKVPLPQDPNPSALLKHTLQHHKLKRLIVTNNGQPFSGNDWSRLKRIAEGNPDETKIGAFGVGFYSVFAECEEPLVRSGNEAMAFYWKGNSLFTRSSKLQDQDNNDTSFILDYRNDTTTIPSLLPLCQFLATSLTFVGISDIELFIDDWRLLQLKKTTSPSRPVAMPKFMSTKTKDGLFKVTSATHETSQLNAIWLKVIGWNSKAVVSASAVSAAKNGRGLQHLWNSITSTTKTAAAEKAAKAEREAEIELAKDLLGEEQATAFLHVTTAQLNSNIEKSFAKELERATKKQPPKTTRLALLTTSHDEAQLSNEPGKRVFRKADVFANVLPRNSGRIFIGFPTHQTTGLGAHISAPSVIPTVERESIDLNARWVRTWNEEMLRAAGMIARIAWCEESIALKRLLDDIVKASGSSKLNAEHIAKILPQALHNLNQYEFSEATPSSKVGNCIEEGFWDCDKSGSLQVDLLSTRGIVPSQDIRLMGTDELSFLEGIPFLPKEVAEKQPAFIKKLIGVGVIAPVVLTDIKRELERQSLSSQQLIEFLQWIAKRVSSKQMDTHGAASLFKVTVANDAENDKVIQLGLIRYFQNPHRIPVELPVPADTIPHKYTKNIDAASLAGLGWEDLQIIPWIKFLLSDARIKDTSKRLDLDQDFAALVLPAISKQWKGLSDSSKQTLKNLLSDKTVIPTKLGMKRPGEAYFKSVKLFEDLPTITISNLSDAFLAALGVRKTIELNLVFERLLNPPKADGTGPAWSHVELIRYLVSVRNDIPSNDIKKLQQTAICTAEGEKDGRRYMLSEIFEPKDELRPLQVKFVFWPGMYRPYSEESKFMRNLGLRTHPTLASLIETSASLTNNPALRDHALQYIVMFQHQHGYPVAEIAKAQIPFLPVESHEKLRVIPSACFTNSRAALFGCQILRQDLHPHAAKLGVATDPPIATCIDWLLKNPPATNRSARELFEYFAARMNEFGGQSVEKLSKANFVPISPHDMVEKEGLQSVRRLPPSMCFLGRGGKYAEILDYVDFGDAANAFLMRCGSKPEPTSLELAKLVIHEPARILNTLNDTKRYLALLTSVADDWSSIKRDKVLVRQMKESSFLLASIERNSDVTKRKSLAFEDEDDEQDTFKSWQLAKADRIVVVDEPTDYHFFKADVLAAPQEEELESLYLALGASTISSVVTQSHRVGGKVSDLETAQKMKKLVTERVKLFLSDMPKEQVKRDGTWVEKNLQLVPVSGMSSHKTLKGSSKKYSQAINAMYNKSQDGLLGQTEHFIYFKPGVKDYYDLSIALCNVCLNKTKPQQAIVLTTLLESNLNTLSSRGYNVSRILRRRQAEDKIQQEEKLKQLEQERARMAAALTSNKAPENHLNQWDSEQTKNSMPGVFPDTPERNSPDAPLGLPRGIDYDPQPLLTSFKDRMRDIWKGGGPIQNTIPRLGSEGLIGQSSHANAENSLTTLPERDLGKPYAITDTSSMQAKLERTIRASKPYNSGSLQSSGVENMVQETPSFCDTKPAHDLSFQGQTSNGVKVFCAKTVADPARFLASNGGGLEAFSAIILQIARAMDAPRQSLHIYHDEFTECIAFNLGQAIFFNYRFFDTMHLADVQQGRFDSAITYWFITMCHEITHNISDSHGPEFNFWMQNLIWLKFTAIGKLLRYDGDAGRNTNGVPPPPYRS